MRDLETSVNTLLDGQEIVDGILVDIPTQQPLPIDLIASIIRNNLPGIWMVIVSERSPFWSAAGNERFMHEGKVILFTDASTCFGGLRTCQPTPVDLSDLLECLEEAMSDAISDDCQCVKCDRITSAWPSFETLAQRITHAVEALS